MKTKSLVLLTMLLVATLSCEKQGEDQIDDSIFAVEAKGIANAPSESGMYVVRGEDQLIARVLIHDAKRNLLAIIASDYTAACAGQGPVTDEAIPFQEILLSETENDVRIVHLSQSDEVTIRVYDTSVYGFSCASINEGPIASGTGSLINTDNDLEAFNNQRPLHNAYGYMSHGMLTDANGDYVMFTAHARFVWDGEDTSTSKSNVSVNLN